MKIYRARMVGDFTPDHSMARWFTRKSDAPGVIRMIKEACLDDNRPDPTVQEFDVPTDKAGLVAFLNWHCDR